VQIERGRAEEPLVLDAVLEPTADPGEVVSMERAGFANAWVTETVRDPFICLARAASMTSTMSLGTGVAIAFARSPMTTALSAYDVQRLCAGRFRLGLGSQVRQHVTRRFSMPWSKPADRMREYVLAVRAIWASWNAGAPLEFTGEFYSHTLMTPFFNPGPSGFGDPPILLAGVGSRMTSVAGEVADGFICGPLTSSLSFREHTLPAIGRGQMERGQRSSTPFDLCVMPLIVTGSDAAATERVATATRSRLAFYASTPAYRSILELHGWGGLHHRLHELSRRGEWDAMAHLVTDEVLEAFAVVAEPDAVARALQERFGGLARRAILHTAVDPGAGVWPAVTAGSAFVSATHPAIHAAQAL
jgi:probable F420-dependent oxidoreductase